LVYRIRGDAHTCATRTDGTLWCWGSNWGGQLGNGTNQGSLVLVQVPGTSWASVNAGAYHTCAVKTDGTLWCWGVNWWGQLGQGQPMTGVKFAAGCRAELDERAFTLGRQCGGIRGDGTLSCWGCDWTGQLGDGSIGDNVVPPVQVGGAEWKGVAPGNAHTCGSQDGGDDVVLGLELLRSAREWEFCGQLHTCESGG